MLGAVPRPLVTVTRRLRFNAAHHVLFLCGVNPTSENIVVARAGTCWRRAARADGSHGSAFTRPGTTMSNTMGSDAVGAAIAPTPWRRRKGEGVSRPLPSDEPFELPPAASPDADRAEFEMLVRCQLELLGEDPDRLRGVTLGLAPSSPDSKSGTPPRRAWGKLVMRT
jgi:hypothetical protein